MDSPSATAEPPRHVSVLPREVVEYLAPAPGQVIVDATVGAGGHARLIAERLGTGGRLVGFDQDAAMLELARSRLEGLPVTLVQANFDRLRRVLDEVGIAQVDGVLADLGVCSDQLDAVARGFSFLQEGPLDMRLDPSQSETAADLLQRNPSPSEEEVRHGLEGNLCRCTGYHNIVKAIEWAAEHMAGKK